MKKDVLLVLEILEGRGWQPIDGHKILIEAQLGLYKLCTDVFPLTNAPKFNTEISWEAEKQTIRSYKLKKVPIKIECFALNEKNQRRPLGYIVLSLASAVEGVEVDSKWYKILGGHLKSCQTPPSLLLRLHLEAMTLDKNIQVNGKQSTLDAKTIMQGPPLEADRNNYALEKAKSRVLMSTKEGLMEVKATSQTNGGGNQRSGKYEENPTFSYLQVEHSRYAENNTNGVCVKRIDRRYQHLDEEDVGADEDEEEEEDDPLEEHYGQEYSDDEEDESNDAPPRMSIDSCSPNESEDDGGSSHVDPIQIQHKDGPRRDRASNKPRKPDGDRDHQRLRPLAETSDAAKRTDEKRNPDANLCESLLKTRTSARDHLREVSEALRASNQWYKSPSMPTIAAVTPTTSDPNLLVDEKRLSTEKRLLDTSAILSGQDFEKLNKIRKVDVGLDTIKSPVDALMSTSNSRTEAEDINEYFLRNKLAGNPGATSIAFHLEKSIGDTSFSSSKAFSPVAETDFPSQRQHTKLVPRLDQDKGCFFIGPRQGETGERFNFSITIVFAKHLNKIVPEELIPSFGGGFQFCYSLLGFSVYTDPFHNLDDPQFLAEKASAVIESSHESLAQYFNQHYFLPVHFMSGETSLGLCTIDISSLVAIATQREAKVEGVYEMNPANAQQSPHEGKALVAVCLEVLKLTDEKVSFTTGRGASLEPKNYDNHMYRGETLNEVVVSDSMTSSEEEDEATERNLKNKQRRGGFSFKNYSIEGDERLLRRKAEREIERKKMILLHDAADEVERWKEEQKKVFLKKCMQLEKTVNTQLATEWSSKLKLIEGELGQRLGECDKLQEKLNSALGELSVREEKVKLREANVNRLEQELNVEKEAWQTKKKVGNKEKDAPKQVLLHKHGETDRARRLQQQLQKEVVELREQLSSSQDLLKLQTEEVLGLRRKLILSDDIIGISQDKETLQKKVEGLQERKTYYKTQWLNSLMELSKYHSNNRKPIDQITSEMRSLPQDFPVSHDVLNPQAPSRVSPVDSAVTGYKVKQLINERRSLVETGRYPENHSILKRIDKSIKELIG